MTDIVDVLLKGRDGMGDEGEEYVRAAEEIKRLRREVGTLRNFMEGIKSNVDLALGDYGQPGSKSYG